MGIDQYLFIVLLLILAICGYFLYLISNAIKSIHIPAIRLETHPFKINITKDIQARWETARQEKIKMVEQKMMTAEQLFDYHAKLQEDFLIIERTGKKDDASLMKAKIEAVETVMGVKI